jgi:hypothetical protein
MSEAIIDVYCKYSVKSIIKISFENFLVNSQSIQVLLFYLSFMQNLITAHIALPKRWAFECAIEFLFFGFHLLDFKL